MSSTRDAACISVHDALMNRLSTLTRAPAWLCQLIWAECLGDTKQVVPLLKQLVAEHVTTEEQARAALVGRQTRRQKAIERGRHQSDVDFAAGRISRLSPGSRPVCPRCQLVFDGGLRSIERCPRCDTALVGFHFRPDPRAQKDELLRREHQRVYESAYDDQLEMHLRERFPDFAWNKLKEA
jgi:hypothetical protein